MIEIIVVDLFGTKAINYEKKYASDSVSQAIGFININFREEITLNIIREKFNVSPAYFSREFKRRTGMCFNDYLAEKRFDYAKKLLEYSDMTVTDICYESGFNDYANFERNFKTRYGNSPRQYRKNAVQSVES